MLSVEGIETGGEALTIAVGPNPRNPAEGAASPRLAVLEVNPAYDLLRKRLRSERDGTDEAHARPNPLMAATGDKTLLAHPFSMDSSGSDRDAGLVLEVMGQGICVCDPGGHVRWANRMFREAPEVLHRRVSQACQRAASAFARLGSALLERPHHRTFKVGLRSIGRFYEIVVSPVVGPEGVGLFASPGEGEAREAGGAQPPIVPLGTAPAVVAVVRDVTSQERLRRKLAAIDRAGNELVHLEAETVKRMHVSERLRLLETKVIRFAHDLLSFDHFTIRLLNPETNELELLMSSGLSEKACAIKLYATEAGNGISGLVAATGRPYVCPDSSRDPLYVYGLEQPGSALTVPLKLFDKVIGVFNVESEKTNAFNDTDRQFAEIFGHYIAMAVHILNLLVVERYTTSMTATGTVQGELSEPLNDLTAEAEALKDQALDPEMARHVERILHDVDSIRRRVKNVARGPQTLLGIDEAIERSEIDPVLAQKRILVADNEPLVRETIREVLARRGCSVTVCDDGASATKLLLQWQLSHDVDQGFDLIISDINLGDKTGYEIFAAVRGASASVPVILMTGFGYDPHHSIVRASQEGLQCVLFKPFQVEKLMEETKKAVGRREVPPPVAS